jgi:Fur family zinc uptake transcriptional regulator
MTSLAFSDETETLLRHAGDICAKRGARLTDLRRLVLGHVLDAAGPVGAYDLLERVRRTRLGAAPPTVYRSLDFLLAHGLIHRLERLSAFVGCVQHDHRADGHLAQFLICRQCGRVIEIEAPDVVEALACTARRMGFALRTATIEAEGVCADCALSHAEPVSAQGSA